MKKETKFWLSVGIVIALSVGSQLIGQDVYDAPEEVDKMKTPKIKSYDGDIIKLKNEIDKLKGEIARLEKLLKDPLSDFR